MTGMDEIRFIDLFAGIGGMRMGVMAAEPSACCVFSCEIDPDVSCVYRDNFGAIPNGDITKIDPLAIPDHDLLCAGFPCQPFSTAGKRLGARDPRGGLIYTVISIIAAKRPRGFILENVPSFATNGNGTLMDGFIRAMERHGYGVASVILDATDFGIPQARRRLFILGTDGSFGSLVPIRHGKAVFSDIMEKGKPCVYSALTAKLIKYGIGRLPGKRINDKRGGCSNIHSWDVRLRGDVTIKQKILLEKIMLERRKRRHNMPHKDGTALDADTISRLAGRDTAADLAELARMGYLRKKDGGYDINGGKLSYGFTHILDPRRPVPTLTATDAGRIGVVDGNGIRHLTSVECVRLMGIHDSYRFGAMPLSKIYKLIGNSVCVPCVKHCMEVVFNSWKK